MRRTMNMFCLAALTSCASVSAEPDQFAGTWGGQHMRLTMGESSGTAEFDCAAAELTTGLTQSASGSFTAEGIYHPGHGGPVRLGERLPSIPARFSGTVDRRTMVLTVKLANGQALGPFTLERGEEAQLFRCL